MISRICQITNNAFQISGDEEEAFNYFGLPLPNICPDERFRRLLAFINGRRLFWRTCDKTGARVYSSYPPKALFPVYDNDYWWSEQWDPFEFGRNFSLRKGFFDQLFSLWQVVPRPANVMRGSARVSACHSCYDVNECYYVFNSCRAQKCLYCVGAFDSVLCVDCLNVYSCELCYECVDCHFGRELRWSEHCINCSSSHFLANCKDCTHCLFCLNMEGKSYHIFNKPVSREEYEKTLAAWDFTDRSQVESAQEQMSVFSRKYPLPHIVTDKIDRISGNYLYRSNQIIESFECVEGMQLIHCHNLFRAQSCIEGIGYGDDLSNAAQFVNVGSKAEKIVNCVECAGNIKDLTYCSHCFDSRHLFACIGLRGKEYCILNKQYTKNAYEELIDQIKKYVSDREGWGEFFPAKFSGYPYNLSLANSYMPLSRVQAKLFNYSWDDELDDLVRPSQLVEELAGLADRVEEMPARLESFKDKSLRQKIFICEMTGMPYQISKEELDLYQRLRVAPPGRVFEQRNKERRLKLAGHSLQIRRSSDVKAKIKTAFDDEWPRPVISFDDWSAQVLR